MRLHQFAALTVIAMTLCGCMGFPKVYLHEYEADLEPPTFFAVEDGQRVELVRINVRRNDQSWMSPDYDVLLIRATSSMPPPMQGDPPLFEDERQLQDREFIRSLIDGPFERRMPNLIADLLAKSPSLQAWNAGYVVATRPLIVAYPLNDRLPPASSVGHRGGLFFVTAAQKTAIVGSLQIREESGRILVADLKQPLTIDRLLDVLATPGPIEAKMATRSP